MKSIMMDGGIEAIMGSMAAGPEMIAVDIAIMGMVVGIKKLADHHKAKKADK
jgi:hypothetical protein